MQYNHFYVSSLPCIYKITSPIASPVTSLEFIEPTVTVEIKETVPTIITKSKDILEEEIEEEESGTELHKHQGKL